MKIQLLIDGGDMKPGPAVAQQLGPKGINIGKVISEVNLATKEFKGMKVPVELDINEKTKEFTIITKSPPTSELIKKELKIEKGSNNHRKIKVGNASIQDVIKIAKIKLPNMLERDLKNAVKSVLGTFASVGTLVENKEPKEIINDIEEGKFNKEISEQQTETPTEKRQSLDSFFKNILSDQEKKAAEEAKESAEAEAKKSEATKEPEKTVEKKAPEKKAPDKKESKK